MSRLKTVTCAQIFVLAILLAGCGRKETDTIDFGTFNKSAYTNVYLGLSVTIPADWSIQDQEAQRRLANIGGKMLSGDDKNLKAALSAAEMQNVNLFAAFKFPLGSSVDFNPSIIGMAEDVRQWPGIKTGKDDLFQVKKALESGQMQVVFPKDVYMQQLGGVDFYVMEAEIPMRGLMVKQKYYSTIKKGYNLGIIVSFTTAEEEASLQKILDGVTLK
jgi:hypothetical protein